MSHLRSSEVNSFNDRNYESGIGRKMVARERGRRAELVLRTMEQRREIISGNVRKKKNLILPFAARATWSIRMAGDNYTLAARAFLSARRYDGGEAKEKRKTSINGVVADRGKLLAEGECA